MFKTLAEKKAYLTKRLAERDQLAERATEIVGAEVGDDKPYPDEDTRSADAKKVGDEIRSIDSELAELASSIDEDEATEARLAKIRETASRATSGVGEFQHRQATPTDVDPVRGARGEVRDAAMKLLERSMVDADRKTLVEGAMSKRTRYYDGDYVARSLIITESDAYQSAFAKAITGREARWTDEERAAMLRYDEFRAVFGSVDTSGGFGIPIVIDPTIRITSGTGLTGLLQYITVEPVTTDAWRGVTAAHTTWTEVSEGAEGTDDAPTFAQPSIPVVTSRATIPYSIEADQDYPGLATQLSRILDSGYMDHLATRLATGTGTTTIKGVFTALDATTGSEVVVTTDAMFGAVDIDKVWAALPERWRSRAVWYMNVDVENEIRGFGSGTATSRFTVDQTAFGISLLNGRPVVLSDHAPTFTATTGAANILAVFDPTEYILAQRVGMSVEYIPHLFGHTNDMPKGQRAWFAYARAGGDIPVTQAGRLLQNT